jgi:hypothetical protein
MISLNNLGQQVIATNSFFYSLLSGNESIRCCDEYQDVQYCFKSNIRQGCAFCDFDPYSQCECAVCEK